jgi:hypothetical protein
LDSEWEGLREPNDSAKDSGVTVLDEYIRANYRRATAFGSFTILEAVNRL